jgi:hypothetical protein
MYRFLIPLKCGKGKFCVFERNIGFWVKVQILGFGFRFEIYFVLKVVL